MTQAPLAFCMPDQLKEPSLALQLRAPHLFPPPSVFTGSITKVCIHRQSALAEITPWAVKFALHVAFHHLLHPLHRLHKELCLIAEHFLCTALHGLLGQGMLLIESH